MDTPTILEDEFEEGLIRLDRAYARLRDICADRAHLESDSSEYENALESFWVSESDIWAFKDIFFRIFRAKRVEEE